MSQALTDHRVATRIAEDAGRLLVDLRRRLTAEEPELIRTQGDLHANERILELLARWRPDDAVLSEESPDDPSRLAARRVWIVDPLDGTREFGEPGRTDWAVHVALLEDGVLAAGAVTLPARGQTFATDPPPPLPPPRPPGGSRRLRVAVSRTRPPAVAGLVQQRLGADLVPIGSAGAKAMAVVTGEVDVYLHAGGQREWDSAAPAAVAMAAGLHVRRLADEPLRYNQPDPWVPDLLICRPELSAEVLGAVAEGIR